MTARRAAAPRVRPRGNRRDRAAAQRAGELLESDNDPEQLLTYERLWFSLSQRVEMDKSGRVRLPDDADLRLSFGYDVTYIDLKNKPDWFLKISPFGKVPVLKVDDTVLFESAVINEYLDEILPEPPFMPGDPGQRARARIWIATTPDAMFAMRAGIMKGETLRGPFSKRRQDCSWIVSIPPIPDPIRTPMRAGSTDPGSSFASDKARRVAATANWV